MLSAVLAVGAAGAAAAMSPASGTIVLRATATYSDGTSADRLYEVKSDADSDGDGLNDSGWLRVACDGAAASAVYYTVKSPRDRATGQASGKRMHKPFIIIKEWGPSTPMFKTGGGKVLGSTLSWDLVKGKTARVDYSGASDASAGEGAKAGPSTELRTGYDVKKVEGTGARSTASGQAKTMAHDSWMTAKLREGSPNLCD